MRKYLFITLAVILVFSLFLISCGTDETTPPATTSQPTTPATTKPAPTTPTPKYGGTLRIGENFFPTSNIGWPAAPRHGGVASCVFMESIITADDTGGIQPALATAWEVSDDLKSITFTLRKGVKFHDGSDWNATVAKWNLDTLIDAKKGDFTYAGSVDIVDEYTIRLNMSEYTNSIFTTLGSTFMLSKAAFDADGMVMRQ